MHTIWHWLLYLLTWASHDPATLAAERARCAGCVNVAYAALAQEPRPAPKREADHFDDASKMVPAPPPAPVVKQPCPQCGDTGRIYRSDGGYVRCPCGACPTGRCPKK
jgi:hypothetical protein